MVVRVVAQAAKSLRPRVKFVDVAETGTAAKA
jgi:hypothetical protein